MFITIKLINYNYQWIFFLVDGDTYLHQEEDPRYRGAAIPSRAFRYLQNMTDSGQAPVNANGNKNLLIFET